jgi:hypothetical protein
VTAAVVRSNEAEVADRRALSSRRRPSCERGATGVPNDVRTTEGGQPTKVADSANLLIERERDVLRMREDIARGVDVQATAVTAATLALVAVAAGGDILSSAKTGWVIGVGILLLLSAVAGGIARLPAPPPLKSLLFRTTRQQTFDLFATKGRATMRRLGRDLGEAIRDSEQKLGDLTVETPSEVVEAEVLAHWRARNRLARYRMHSKSAWFTLSLVLLYAALLLAAASVL